ncbi:MAG: hypothetical protein JRS35_04515 [Deltaproteobacteria bacterium]|nr:hypothetical protein [Deltaproteobacteria bacterium]
MDRRGFLECSGGALLSLGLVHLIPAAPKPSLASPGADGAAPLPKGGYPGWQDVWRERWTRDKVVHSSHARANRVSTCSWNIFVRDGVARREEQNAIYEACEARGWLRADPLPRHLRRTRPQPQSA